ncbi:hypothetical protein N9Y42_05165 [Mariniblastus sp.]|nr:hypothetical protein [Mariniblastus sp.]
MVKRLCLGLVALSLFVLPQVAQAHDIFVDVLKEEYMLKSFSCKTCHAESDKKIRTPFAERIYVELKPLGYEAKYEAAKKLDDAAKAKDPKSVGKDKGAVHDLELVMAVEFKKAFAKVSQQSMTFDELIRAGLFYGARLDTKKIEEAEAAKKAAEGGEKSPGDAEKKDGVSAAKED